MAGTRRPLLSTCAREDGFTIIEVMVAAAVLLVGLVGVLGIVSNSDAVTASNRAREQGVALQREIIEAAQAIPYDQLSQTTIVSKLSATAGLTDSTMTSAGWTFRRRNVNYAVAVGTCAVDDPTDGTGPHETTGYCLDGTGATTPAQCLQYLGRSGDIAGNGTASGYAIGDCGIDTNRDGNVDGLTNTSGGTCTNCSGSDSNPNDYKRIVVLVRWNRGLGTRYALQSTTVPNPGLAAAPAITSLTPASRNVVPGDQIITFNVTLNRTPAAVPWYVDGTAYGQATGSGTNWAFSWNLGAVNTTAGGTPNPGEILDGTYVVSAKGVDQYGQAGTAKASTVIINRRVPYAPTNVHAGRNDNNGYIDWGTSPERDVQGYNVYRVGSPDQLVCSMVRITRCKDTGLPTGAAQYYVRAVDRDSAGNLRNGDASAMASVPAADQTPFPVINLNAAKSGSNTILSWQVPTPADPDTGDSIQFFRIYRDGTDWIDNFYAQTASGSNFNFTDSATGGDVHTYYVVAVDQSFTESRPWGNGITK